MKKKTPPKDVNVNAFEILNALTGDPATSHNETSADLSRNGTELIKKKKPTTPEKNPAAVALGRLGGLKGGKARMEKLSPKRRAEIAKKAARARWKSR